jgi:hypothetical protein
VNASQHAMVNRDDAMVEHLLEGKQAHQQFA